MSFALNALAGAVCGVLSGYGIGGGSLLLIYLAHVAGVGQTAAQGINLIYFLPTSASALILHAKNGLIEKKAFVRAVIPGMICSFAAAFLATSIDSVLLRRIFGIFLIAVGVKMLFGRTSA